MARRMLALDEIILSDELYPRTHTDFRTVKTYAEAMLQGATFPPLTVVEDQGTYYLLDGWHRHAAWKQVGMGKIPVKIKDISRDQWFAVALAENTKHGRPLTQKEKVTAILRLRRSKVKDADIGELLQMTTEYVHRLIETKAAITDVETGNGIALKPALAEVKTKIEASALTNNIEAIQKRMSGQRQFSMIRQVTSLVENNLLNEDDERVTNSLAALFELLKPIFD